MNNKTIAEIKEEIEVLKKSLKNKIDEFAKANPELELNIWIEPIKFKNADGSTFTTYDPNIEVTLK